MIINLLSANLTKWTNTPKQFVGNHIKNYKAFHRNMDQPTNSREYLTTLSQKNKNSVSFFLHEKNQEDSKILKQNAAIQLLLLAFKWLSLLFYAIFDITNRTERSSGYSGYFVQIQPCFDHTHLMKLFQFFPFRGVYQHGQSRIQNPVKHLT